MGTANDQTARPAFPKRAVVTGGMPYGNKELHLGHIGGVFLHADTYARFLRDRIGPENVIFVSGTDCYGSPILESWRRLVEDGQFKGTIEEYVEGNHVSQRETLKAYDVRPDVYGASGLGRTGELHRKMTEEFITGLYEKGWLAKLTTSQFYDTERQVFLNGRQVVGQCPIEGCASERGYADECALGHQYMPADLINPRSTLSGKKPEMRDVVNWYFRLEEFEGLLERWLEDYAARPTSREFAVKSMAEFLEKPVIYVKKDFMEELGALRGKLPPHALIDEAAKTSAALAFETLALREKACATLSAAGIRFRTGKTLVPFRLTGNIPWGVPAPALEGLTGLTVWVWPESLWAPISFTMAALEARGRDPEGWRDWWCAKDAKVYQFIGQDNVYFYGPAEMAMFMAQQGAQPSADPHDGEMQLPDLVVNNHLLFLDKKASSSGAVKPPMAAELLEYYTPGQLRAHFLGLGLGIRSVGFKPKPFNPAADPRQADPVLKEGNLLTNVLNRVVRSCFYTAQKYFDGRLPLGPVSEDVLAESRACILEYERLMHRCEFHTVMNLTDTYIRSVNKRWADQMRAADAAGDGALRRQALIDGAHGMRTALLLMHPVAPEGTETAREYLRLPESFWSWEHAFEPVYFFMGDPERHELKFLEPRVDFFGRHPRQVEELGQGQPSA
jgi:methionyl-tRNA synthetase